MFSNTIRYRTFLIYFAPVLELTTGERSSENIIPTLIETPGAAPGREENTGKKKHMKSLSRSPEGRGFKRQNAYNVIFRCY